MHIAHSTCPAQCTVHKQKFNDMISSPGRVCFGGTAITASLDFTASFCQFLPAEAAWVWARTPGIQRALVFKRLSAFVGFAGL